MKLNDFVSGLLICRANVGDGVIIEVWLTKHIALRHGCKREGKMNRWWEEYGEAESAG